jgi:hypothetical protein
MRKQTFATLVICLAFVYSAEAANLASSAPSDGKTVVTLSGEVTQGDADVLGKLLKAGNDRGHRVAGIRLNSTGGNLLEGIMLGRLVSEGKIATIVDEGAKCTAACFVVFVAGSPKYVHERAAVGVHGAAETSGEETMPSRSATLSTAEIVKEFGVPAGIIAKLVVTPRQQVVWLSPDELRLMGAKRFRTRAPGEKIDRLQAPLAGPRSSRAEPPSWKQLFDVAVGASAEQNNGNPRYNRGCDWETKTCWTGVWVKNQTGDIDRLVQVTKDMAGKTLTRELCMFDVSGSTRVCLDWDTDASSREIKNFEGKWIQIAED